MDRILGQDRALDTLRRALGAGRVHHAWIFSGPRGVGKFTTAIELARILLDPDAGPNLAGEIEANPDGRISHLVDADTHPDLHVIRKELALFSDDPAVRRGKQRNIAVAVLRQHLIGGEVGDRFHDSPAWCRPSLGHGKVFIVDEAELIDPIGQNALLKTLEEPPPETYLVLVTSRPERLLPTIRSRCQQVRFQRLDDDAMTTWLDRAGLELDADQRTWILRFAEGAPGVAALAAQYGFFEWQRRLEPMLRDVERGRFVPDLGDTLAAVVDEFAAAWVKANRNASKDAANKDGLRHLLAMLAARLRRSLADAAADGRDPTPVLTAIDLLRDAERQADTNVNLKHVLGNLSAQWCEAAV